MKNDLFRDDSGAFGMRRFSIGRVRLNPEYAALAIPFVLLSVLFLFCCL